MIQLNRIQLISQTPLFVEITEIIVWALATFGNTSLSIVFKTALILFAFAVMKLKHLPTTYFTVLPIQTKE